MSESKLQCPQCGSTRVTRHHSPVVPKDEGDFWAPRREEGYQCAACKLIESCFNDDYEYEAFRDRWNDPIKTLSVEEHQAFIDEQLREKDEAARAWTWPTEWPPDSGGRVTDRSRRAATLIESRAFSEYKRWITKERGEELPAHKYGYPVGEEYVAAVLKSPDDDAPRWAYARWLRTYEHRAAQKSAEFVEWQLRLAESLRTDPRGDIKSELPDGVFSPREDHPTDIPDQPWWRYPGASTSPETGDCGLGESIQVLEREGLIDRSMYFRGFIEHVAVKAHRFLEIADELYSLAPIRHLTITYCKGLDHKDEGLWKALLASPHLDRIRSLKLPVRIFGIDNQYTELNRITDASRAAILSRVSGGKAYDLATEYFVGMPSWQDAGDPHYQFWMTHTPRGTVVDDPMGVGQAMNLTRSYTGTAFSMYSHTGTHIDALNHFGIHGKIWNGFEADTHLGDRGWKVTGIEKFPPLIARGVLIDVAGAKGVDMLPDSYRVTRQDLKDALARQHVTLQRGDVVLIRTGRMRLFEQSGAYMANPPGMGLDAARFLVEDSGAMIVGADNLSFETFPSEVSDDYVPLHTYLLAQQGAPIIELVALDELARDQVYEFAFIGGPLKIRGGDAAPLRPVALPVHR